MLWGNSVDSVDALLRGAGRRILDEQPELEPLLLRLRDAYARGYVATTALTVRLRYDAPAYPYRMIRVDPAEIERVVEFQGPKFRAAGTVVGGDWDLDSTEFTDLDVYRAYERHFEEGVPWSETAFFERVLDEIDEGREPWGCSTHQGFRARCERLDQLYETIATEGYRTQAELMRTDAADPIKEQNRLPTERLKDEIAVHIGRDGELLFEDGRNRLSIVKLLGLDAVPVRVLRRHTAWQGIRDAYVRGEPAAEKYCGHPDLAALSFGCK